MAGGRPTDYDDNMLNKAHEYLAQAHDTNKDGHYRVQIPKVEGLALYLGISRDTCYEWAKVYPEFSDILERVGAMQAERLIDRGLEGTYNPTIAKLLLTKHGYKDMGDVTSDNKAIPPLLVKFLDGKDNGDTQGV